MELDHIQPKAEHGADHLINRILVCRPCNARKSDKLTMNGLRKENRKVGWMKDLSLANQAQQKALVRTSLIRDNFGGPGFTLDELLLF